MSNKKQPSVPMYPQHHKVWGWTQHIFLSSEVEICRAHIITGGYCSKHYHKNKVNRFHVLSGKLEIIVYRNGQEEHMTMTTGMTLDIQPKVQHKMVCHKECDFIEIYWSDNDKLRFDDIVREDEGGVLANKPLVTDINNNPFTVHAHDYPITDGINPEALQWLDKFYENYPH